MKKWKCSNSKGSSWLKKLIANTKMQSLSLSQNWNKKNFKLNKNLRTCKINQRNLWLNFAIFTKSKKKNWNKESLRKGTRAVAECIVIKKNWKCACGKTCRKKMKKLSVCRMNWGNGNKDTNNKWLAWSTNSVWNNKWWKHWKDKWGTQKIESKYLKWAEIQLSRNK